MGLDTTHDAWHGPYSSFNKWRTWLAKFEGIELDKMQGYGGDIEWTKEQKESDYYPLLFHSDCDGELSVEECKQTGKWLDKLIEKYKPEKPDNGKMIDWNLQHAVSFMLGCKKAISANEPIEFH